jgi:hypothetical protein
MRDRGANAEIARKKVNIENLDEFIPLDVLTWHTHSDPGIVHKGVESPELDGDSIDRIRGTAWVTEVSDHRSDRPT